MSDHAMSDRAVSDNAVSDSAVSDRAVSDNAVSDNAVSDPGRGSVDLTPRDEGELVSRRRRSGLGHWMPRLVLVAIVVVLGFVLFQTLTSARLFFYNVDDAVSERAELGDKRFEVQGTPYTAGTDVVVAEQPSVAFSFRFNDVDADVVHVGSPAELFQPGVPVVLEGRWVPNDAGIAFADGANDGYYFESNRMLVKHDNEYRVDNPERIAEAQRGGEGTQ